MIEQEPAAPDASAEIVQIEAQMAADPASYWNSGAPERYKALIEARESGQPAPARGASPAAELRSIETLMREEPARYWNAPALQSRYRALLEGQAEREAARPPAEATEHEALPTLSEALAENPDLDQDAFMACRGLASDVLIAVDDPGEAAILRSSFDQLGEVGVFALGALAELGAVHPSSPVSADDAETFGRIPAGRTLLAEWGDESAYRLGVAHTRIARILVQLPQAEGHKLLIWLWTLPDQAMTAVLRRLAR